ncbi:MAG: YceI family protein [Chitinophagaceae bacterium]
MATWTIDTAHSEIGFKVKHLVISTVSGKFTAFEGKVDAAKEDFTDAKISFSADINSIHTGNDQRDGHLKSDDFFNAEKFPKISFQSTAVEHKSGSDYFVKGNLTIRDITKPVELKAEFGGTQKDFSNQTVAGFELTGKISRSEFGLKWNGITEAGGIVVSDDVKLVLNVEIVKAADQQAVTQKQAQAETV